ncbi:HAD family hydrolase [Corynebacterium glutamicum]|nr:HAD family hydrolase [Corynebacterium glutamicum]AGN19196.1 hypothetical protein C624_08105 [Corynebacterium glutamicum SCgG1]AGN22221.1 hypothetical protein C629_08115 [Corynebacterium glutamicum SCgG2]EGV40757.1 hypothetical protein CgS9114_07155 [Corynebacterium glutamicum S9114]EOA64517.1 hypothetical protein J433_08905 [Corynebacterium glutamicum MT]EPP40680.1 hypothetical protein A583_07630 [Corynebacterium glutamicum Z188]QXU47270.1 HAD family hydrolase [[Brevibacterium] flavum]
MNASSISSRFKDLFVTPSIVFDFDGTLAIGHGPVLAYALCVAPEGSKDFLERVRRELRRYDDGQSIYRDGYDIVAKLASELGIDDGTMSVAYGESRKLLGSDLAPVEHVRGIKDILSSLKGHARLVLATNAPENGVHDLLRQWGVADLFDQLHFVVGKPAGLISIISDLQLDGPVLAVGDIYEFDLSPAAQLGADTALVGATATISEAKVSMRGDSIADLPLLAWVSSRVSSS